MSSDLILQIQKYLYSKNIARIRSHKPVFILGNHKTGSTAIAACLAGVSGHSVTLDIVRSIKKPQWKIEVRRGRADFDSYLWRYRKEFSNKIIKEPGLTFFYEELATRFPTAEYVMIVRDPVDNIRSILNRLAIPGDLGHLDVSRYPRLEDSAAWKINLDGSWLGIESKHYIEVLAHRWRICAETYLQASNKFELISYEAFCADRVSQTIRLATALGLRADKDISSIAATQFQSKGEAGTNTLEFFGERNIERIYSIVSDVAEKIGYPV